MRVAWLTSFHQECGLATYARDLTDALVALGVEIEIFAPTLRAGDVAIDARAREIPRLWRGNRAFGVEAIGVVRAIERARCDVVHANVNLSLFSSRFLFTLARLLEARRVPLVATLHGRDGGDLGRRFKVWRLHAALRSADLVVHHQAHADELAQIDARLPRALRRRGAAHVIAHGLPPLRRAPLDDAKRALGLDPRRQVVAHFGFLGADKGVLETMRAIAALRRRGRDVTFLVSGAVYAKDAGSELYFERCRREAAALGVDDLVRFEAAFAPDDVVRARLQAADWIVLNYATGSAQATSGAVTRALASGRPVAVSKATVFDDVRAAVHTLEAREGEALADALAALLDEPARGASIVARAESLLAETSWPNVAARHRDLYARLVRAAR